MANKYNVNDKVIGRSIRNNMTFGVITDITQPQRGQRGYVYTVKWDDGSQSEEFERNLWKNTSIGTDRDDDDEDDDSDAILSIRFLEEASVRRCFGRKAKLAITVGMTALAITVATKKEYCPAVIILCESP